VETDGAHFLPYVGAAPFDSAAPGSDAIVFDAVVFAPAIGVSLSAEITRLKPDVLLVDTMLAAALAAAQASGVPTVAMGSTLHSFLEGTPLKAPVEACDLVLTFSYRAFELDVDMLPHVAHVGPLRPREEAPASYQRRKPHVPLVVASLSTSHQAQEILLQRLCDALGDLPIEAIVTTGRGVGPESLTAGENTTVLRHIAHENVLPQADLLVTHAGHGTVMAGAVFGVPMLCLPMGRDQPFVAQRVADLGLGSVLDQDASVEEVKAKIAKALADRSLSARSRTFADQVRGEIRAGHAAELVEGLLNVG